MKKLKIERKKKKLRKNWKTISLKSSKNFTYKIFLRLYKIKKIILKSFKNFIKKKINRVSYSNNSNEKNIKIVIINYDFVTWMRSNSLKIVLGENSFYGFLFQLNFFCPKHVNPTLK